MKRILGIIFIGAYWMAACSPQIAALVPPPQPAAPEVPATAISSTAPRRIMPMGDSLTEGQYPEKRHSYRGYLETQLREAGYHINFVGSQSQLAHGGTDYDHEGHSGFTIGPDGTQHGGKCGNIYENLEIYLAAEPDIILLLIGINDMLPAEHRPINPAEAADKLEALVLHIQDLAPETDIFVASLAPVNWAYTEPWTDYDAVNAAAEKLGQASPDDRIYFVDLNRALNPIIMPGDYADGLHFAEAGARKMAAVWFEALVNSGVLED